MYFHIIASGSKGNATLIVSKNTRILIDMGISFIRLKEGLNEIGLEPNDITAFLFTHNHSDHINGLKFLSTKNRYCLSGTLPGNPHEIELFKPFNIGDFAITAIKTSHDAINPCGFVLEDKDSKLVYITDTGYFPNENIPFCQNPDYLLIESNHDISMELKTNRPELLKERIMGEKGHLCNEDSAFAALDIIGERTKEIVLMHLSEEANTPEIALKAYKKIFDFRNFDFSKIKIRTSAQYSSLTGGNYED